MLIVADVAGQVTLRANGVDLWATVTLPAEVETPGAFTVAADNFAETLAKLRKGGARNITVTQGEGRAMIRGSGCRGRFNAPTMPADGFPWPATADAALPVAFEVPAGRFLADLGALAPCQSSEETRYYLNGIALQVRDLGGRDRLAMIATDGSNIAAASRALPAGAEALPDAIICRRTVAALIAAGKLAPDAEAVIVTHEARGNVADWMTFTLGNVEICAKVIDGTYPDWARPFASNLAPTGEEAAMFPELLPGAPLGAMQRIAKGVAGAIAWEPAASGMLGTLPDDTGMVFGAINLAGNNSEPVKGYRVGFEASDADAARYLRQLAEARGGQEVRAENARLIVRGGAYQGLTIGERKWIPARQEKFDNWETLHTETITIEAHDEWAVGSHSILMPSAPNGSRTCHFASMAMQPCTQSRRTTRAQSISARNRSAR
jgi:hypothetical protein